MFLEILLLIVWIYLSIMFSLFFYFLKSEILKDRENMQEEYDRRTILFDKIYNLLLKIDKQTKLIYNINKKLK